MNLEEKQYEPFVSEIEKSGYLETSSLSDWWVSPAGQPIMLWEDMIKMSLWLLTHPMTKEYFPDFYMAKTPEYDTKPYTELPEHGVSGAKRVNAHSGDYTDYSDFTGMNAIAKLMTGQPNDIEKAPTVKSSDKLFRFNGKDESCMVEGTWHNWLCFARNVLASPNTEIVAPELYKPELKNDNY